MKKKRNLTEYDKQAIAFLEQTKTTFKAEFMGNMKHFEDDKEKRDVYQVTLEREGTNKAYSFKFGQSLANSGTHVKRNPNGRSLWDNELIPRGCKYPNSEAMSRLGKGYRIPPTEYDVLACLTKYDPGSFDDFCSDFGYDTDSRQAEKTYRAVLDEWYAISSMFNAAEIDIMQEIQ